MLEMNARNIFSTHGIGPSVLAGLLLGTAAAVADPATQIRYLSGTDKDHTVDWEFFCTGGRQSGKWTTIPVPSNWELQGFGEYNYGTERQKADEQGKYRYHFEVPDDWSDKAITIVFEGVMTDAEVSINGQSAGPVHQGGFYRFSYDVTDKINFNGENLLEVIVSKVSANRSIEIAERQADYWVFGGIYRPVYLKAMPREHIERTAIDARADGSFRIDVFTKNIDEAATIEGRILDANGNLQGYPFSEEAASGDSKASLQTHISAPETWTAETPNLYQVQLNLKRGDTLLHTMTERFGFRTIEVRPGDGIYVNDVKVRLKGIDRHSFWPDSGRCLSEPISREDILLIKSMNMNAVRMSHYPPDTHFLKLCDELGLYVIDELCTWQRPSYETSVARRIVKEVVVRDVNHPCILFWANGNEGGWNREVDGDYALYDPQNRTVIHPWELFNHIDTDHYENYESVQRKLSGEDLFMPTETLHGLYDGGHGAGLNDYWNLIRNSPLGAGMFLWVLADEGVVRTDQGGRLDTAGNQAPDGIVGPYREKEGSYFTVKEIWSPVQISMQKIPEDFNGEIAIANDYDFTNLDQCRYDWQWIAFPGPDDIDATPGVLASGSSEGPDIGPKDSGTLKVGTPQIWRSADALRLTFTDPAGRSIWTWTWGLKEPTDYRKALTRTAGHFTRLEETENQWIVEAGAAVYSFNKETGLLAGVHSRGREISLKNGPRLVVSMREGENETQLVKVQTIAKREDKTVVIESERDNEFEWFRWRIHPSGLLELDYRYRLEGAFDNFGITFDYPESNFLGMRWLGQGPYRVWKNRMRGARLGVWRKAYNDTIPGQSWGYPEFKGYHGGFHWALWETREGPIKVFTDTDGLFMRLFTPETGVDPRNTAPVFPAGDVSFMHAISPMGTKFIRARDLGPESRPTRADGVYTGVLYFEF